MGIGMEPGLMEPLTLQRRFALTMSLHFLTDSLPPPLVSRLLARKANVRAADVLDASFEAGLQVTSSTVLESPPGRDEGSDCICR